MPVATREYAAVNMDRLAARVNTQFTVPVGITYDGTTLAFYTDTALSVEQEALLDSLLAGHEVETLQEAKTRATAEIQAERDRRMLLGFQYSGVSAISLTPVTLTFSRSDRAEKNYQGLAVNPARVASYPTAWNDKDDQDALLLPDQPALLAFINAGLDSIAAVVAQAGGYTFQVITAPDIPTVEAVKAAYFAEPPI